VKQAKKLSWLKSLFHKLIIPTSKKTQTLHL